MHTFEQQLTTSRNFNHFERVFVSAKTKTFLLRCHFHGIILLQSSPETSRLGAVQRQIVQQRRSEYCSEWIIWPGFSHGCGKFGSWFQNLPVSRLQLLFQPCKLNVLDVAVNSGYDRFDDHLIQSNSISEKKDLSSSPCSSASSCESDFPKSSQSYFHVMAISFVY